MVLLSLDDKITTEIRLKIMLSAAIQLLTCNDTLF